MIQTKTVERGDFRLASSLRWLHGGGGERVISIIDSDGERAGVLLDSTLGDLALKVVGLYLQRDPPFTRERFDTWIGGMDRQIVDALLAGDDLADVGDGNGNGRAPAA